MRLDYFTCTLGTNIAVNEIPEGKSTYDVRFCRYSLFDLLK